MPKGNKYFKIDRTKPKNEALLKLIDSTGLSLTALQKEIKIHKTYLSRALCGKPVSLNVMKAIARYFKCDTRDIFY
jgi:hypothetical protein